MGDYEPYIAVAISIIGGLSAWLKADSLSRTKNINKIRVSLNLLHKKVNSLPCMIKSGGCKK